MIGNHAQAIALGDGGQDELSLHHGEVVADTPALAAAEGKSKVFCS
jgi:hypothetical protein